MLRRLPRLFAFHAVLLVLAGAFLLSGGGEVEVDASTRVLMAGDARNRETYEKVSSLVPEQTLVLVAARLPEVFTNDGAEFVRDLGNRLWSIPDVVEVKSLIHSTRPVRKGFGLDFQPFIPESATPREWRQIRERVLRHPMSRNVLVSDDGRHAVFLVFLERMLNGVDDARALRDQFQDAVAPYRSLSEDITLVSFPFVEVEMHDDLAHDVRRFAWMVGLLIAAILAVTFRSVWLILLLLIQSALGLGLPSLLLSGSGSSINLYTGLLYPLTGGVHLTFLTHLYVALRRSLHGGLSERDACAAAVAHTLRPSFFATLTTCLGFLSLLFCDVGLVRELGLGGAGCVLGAFLLTYLGPVLVAGPARIFRSPRATIPPEECIVHARHTALAGFIVRHRRFLLSGYALLLLLAVVPALRIRTDIRAMEFLRKGSESRKALELLNNDLGGFNLFQATIDTKTPDGIQDVRVLRFMDELRAYAAKVPGVADAYAYSQVFTMMNHIWEGEAPGTEVLPENPLTLFTFKKLVNSQQMLFQDQFVGGKRESALFLVRTRDMPARDYLAIIENITAHARKHLPKGVTFEPVEGIHSLLEGDRRMVNSQSGSLLTTFAAILGCLALAWRSLRPGFLSIITNLAPVAAVFATMGLAAYPLNSITVMVASIVLGIAVDDSIHMLSTWRELARLPGLTVRDRLARLFASKLVPVACTSAILAACFGLFAVSSFPPVVEFGILCAIALAGAFLSVVIVLPALLAAPSRDQ